MEREAEKRKVEDNNLQADRVKAEKARLNDKKEKELALLRKADAAPKKRVPAKKGKVTADDIKKKEKEEKAREEEEKRGMAGRAEVERKEVSKEVAIFNQRLMRVKDAFSRAGSSVVNMLRLADTNNDGTISLQEFMTTLQRANVSIKPDELLYVYGFIDTNNDGKLSYKELAEVLRGQRNIDAAAHIAKQRKEKGLDHGYTPSELDNINDGSKKVSFDKQEIRSIGENVSGMSSILRKSDGNARDIPPLTDPDEHRRNLNEIRDTLLVKAFSFEDILSQMGMARPDHLSKVTFEDFCRVVMKYCGQSRFSGYQIKFVFKEVA